MMLLFSPRANWATNLQNSASPWIAEYSLSRFESRIILSACTKCSQLLLYSIRHNAAIAPIDNAIMSVLQIHYWQVFNERVRHMYMRGFQRLTYAMSVKFTTAINIIGKWLWEMDRTVEWLFKESMNPMKSHFNTTRGASGSQAIRLSSG